MSEIEDEDFSATSFDAEDGAEEEYEYSGEGFESESQSLAQEDAERGSTEELCTEDIPRKMQDLLNDGAKLVQELETAGLAEPLIEALLQSGSAMAQTLRRAVSPAATDPSDDDHHRTAKDISVLSTGLASLGVDPSLNTNEHLRLLVEDGATLLERLEQAGMAGALIDSLLTDRGSIANRVMMEVERTSSFGVPAPATCETEEGADSAPPAEHLSVPSNDVKTAADATESNLAPDETLVPAVQEVASTLVLEQAQPAVPAVEAAPAAMQVRASAEPDSEAAPDGAKVPDAGIKALPPADDAIPTAEDTAVKEAAPAEAMPAVALEAAQEAINEHEPTPVAHHTALAPTSATAPDERATASLPVSQLENAPGAAATAAQQPPAHETDEKPASNPVAAMAFAEAVSAAAPPTTAAGSRTQTALPAVAQTGSTAAAEAVSRVLYSAGTEAEVAAAGAQQGPERLPQEAWVQLRYDSATEFDVRAQQRLRDVLALIGGVRCSAVTQTDFHTCEGASGADRVAIKVRINDDTQWAAAWARVQAARGRVAARLGCERVDLSAVEPDWRHVPRRWQPPEEPDALEQEADGHGLWQPVPKAMLKRGFLRVLQRTGGGKGSAGWKRAWFVLSRDAAGVHELAMFRGADGGEPLMTLPLVGTQLGSLPGGEQNVFAVRVAGADKRQLRLKAETMSEFASWITAFETHVPGVKENWETLSHLEEDGGLRGVGREEKRVLREALAEGLRGFKGAVSEAVAPLADVAGEMRVSLGGQTELMRESLAAMHAEMQLAREEAARDRGTLLAFTGKTPTPSVAVADVVAQERPPSGGPVSQPTGVPAPQTSTLVSGADWAPGLMHQGPDRTGEQKSQVAPAHGAEDDDGEMLVEAGRVRVRPQPSDSVPLGRGARPRKQILRRREGQCCEARQTVEKEAVASGEGEEEALINAFVQLSEAEVVRAVWATQAACNYGKKDMPSPPHMRAAGFANEALALTYVYGGWEQMAGRLGLRTAEHSVANSRYSDWNVVEKAVRRASTALQVSDQRNLSARAPRKSKLQAEYEKSQAAKKRAKEIEERGYAESARAENRKGPQRMPNSSQLRAQGMEQVDKAIREVHGGYAAVAQRLGLAPSESETYKPQLHPKRKVDERADGDAGLRTRPEGPSLSEPAPVWGGKPFQATIPAHQDVGFYQDLRNLRLTIEEVVRAQSAGAISKKSAMRWMPTERQLVEHGLEDAVAAIKLRHGGMHTVARKLGFRIQGPGMRASWNAADSPSSACRAGGSDPLSAVV